MATTIFFAALALYVIVGALVARRIRSSDDFYIMGERGSTVLIVGTLAATYLSAVTLLGIAGVSYQEGPLVLVATGSFGAWIGTLLAVIYVGRKFKSFGCRTMPDFFRDRFNNTWVTVVATLIMIVGLLGYGVIQLIGAGLVLSRGYGYFVSHNDPHIYRCPTGLLGSGGNVRRGGDRHSDVLHYARCCGGHSTRDYVAGRI